ncbi:MAG: hypothetical protein ABI618_17825 [Nitrospirota bacterium]
MEALVKFCKPEHNILNKCHEIRFGTLQDYREMDPSFSIADQEEGREYTDILSADPNNTSPEALKKIPPFWRGATISYSRVETTFPNCYIWCCSMSDKPVSTTMGLQFHVEYTSFYEITDAFRFSEYLAGLLVNFITCCNFTDSSKNILQGLSVREMGGSSLQAIHHPVLYVPQKRSEINQGLLTTYEKNIPEDLRPLFTKLDKYKKEQEYRFVFIFHHNRGGTLAVRKDPVQIPILPIAYI